MTCLIPWRDMGVQADYNRFAVDKDYGFSRSRSPNFPPENLGVPPLRLLGHGSVHRRSSRITGGSKRAPNRRDLGLVLPARGSANMLLYVDTLAIIRQLQDDPALKAELRAVLPGDEILSLPELVKENSRQIAENSRQIAELIQVTQAHSKRLQRVEDQVGDIVGTQLEEHVKRYPGQYLQRKYVTTLHLVPEDELDKLLDALSEDEQSELERIDAVLSGSRRPDALQSYVAVEASAKAERHDLERALKRAHLLAKAAHAPALPLVVTRHKPDSRIVSKASAMGVALSTKDDGLVLEAPWITET